MMRETVYRTREALDAARRREALATLIEGGVDVQPPRDARERDERRREILRALIADQRHESIRPEYSDAVDDTTVLGILVAKYLRWDGGDILRVAAAALADANFHDEAAKVAALIERGQ